jgi:outer membrane immunogenic protein
MNKATLPAILILAASAAIASPAAAEPFEGPYAGIQAGVSHSKIGPIDTDIGTANINRSPDDATAGIFVGYNFKPAERIVLSAEGGFNLGFSDSVTRTGPGTLASIDPQNSFDLGLRAGYLVTDNTLLYVRGSYENMRAAFRVTDAAGARYSKGSIDGYSIGGGIERALTDRISARLEYRYSDLGGSDAKFERHQALVGVAYHF